MADTALTKRWKTSEVLLRRARNALLFPASEEERVRCLETEFLEYLSHNEHELALDKLQELGELTAPRGGFWKDLVRAAENMQLAARIPYLQKKYEEALSRRSENDPMGEKDDR